MSLFLSLLIAAQASTPNNNPDVARVLDRARQETAKKQETVKEGVQQQQEPAPPLPVPPEIAARFQECIDAANNNVDKGLQYAGQWLVTGGSFYARQCQGYAFGRGGRWTPAQVALEQAANEADVKHDAAAGRLWAQAGNAALVAGDFAKARTSFDAAIARGLPEGIEKGEAYLDRARAAVALGDLKAARTDMDKALEQVPADPLAWLLSATLARRSENLALAEKHIAEAVRLSPDDAAVAFEEGNIAKLKGKDDVAKAAWERAVKLGPDHDEGKAAAANLAELENLAEFAKLPVQPVPAAK